MLIVQLKSNKRSLVTAPRSIPIDINFEIKLKLSNSFPIDLFHALRVSLHCGGGPVIISTVSGCLYS